MKLRSGKYKKTRKSRIRLTEEERKHIINRRKMTKQKILRNTQPNPFVHKGMTKMINPKNNSIFNFSQIQKPDYSLFDIPIMEINSNLFKYPKTKSNKSKKPQFFSHSEMKQYSTQNGHTHFLHKIRDEDPNKINISINKNGEKTHKSIKKRP
jgi:hypothetical protein